ncbi:hypothetical protein J3F83DRAFT_9888 [Trichoderma novae-zelandiae]
MPCKAKQARQGKSVYIHTHTPNILRAIPIFSPFSSSIARVPYPYLQPTSSSSIPLFCVQSLLSCCSINPKSGRIRAVIPTSSLPTPLTFTNRSVPPTPDQPILILAFCCRQPARKSDMMHHYSSAHNHAPLHSKSHVKSKQPSRKRERGRGKARARAKKKKKLVFDLQERIMIKHILIQPPSRTPPLSMMLTSKLLTFFVVVVVTIPPSILSVTLFTFSCSVLFF